MPDSTIYAKSSGDDDDVQLYGRSTSDWATARGDASTSGYSRNATAFGSTTGVYNRKSSGRGSATWTCFRSYFSFNVSGESGTVDSATIKIYLKSNS